jgi:prevent-host-death family protein
MRRTSFTELRKNAKKYFDAVESGESVEVTRRGRVIARIIPSRDEYRESWKEPALRLSVVGESLSKYILEERDGKGE